MAENEEKKEKVKLVKMVRKLEEGQKGPIKADVHPDEVENYKASGWKKK